VDDTTARGRGARSGAKALLAWLAILALVAAVGWLMAERNARQWFLVPENGLVVVKRGMRFPVGRQAYQPEDPGAAEVYAPLVPPPGAAVPAEGAYDDRTALDQALLDLLVGWAREDVKSGDPARLERGLGYLGRAERLGGISVAQREALGALRAESAFYEAQRLLGRGAEWLRQAIDKLRLAASAPTPRGAEAQGLLRQVEGAADAVIAASRSAQAPPPPATPAPPTGEGAGAANPPEGPEAPEPKR
jgi:hypothetical protein